MRTRTFIAVAASDEIRLLAEDLIAALRPAAGDVKWVEAENLHWTLQFLGDVEDTQIPAVCDKVAIAVRDLEPFMLTARGVGAFPSADRPRTLWLGAADGSPQMVAVQKAIERKLRNLGFRGENRRFVPHLTLGRAGRRSHPAAMSEQLAALADFEAGTMTVDEVTVFASRLRREGPAYHVLGRAVLGG